MRRSQSSDDAAADSAPCSPLPAVPSDGMVLGLERPRSPTDPLMSASTARSLAVGGNPASWSQRFITYSTTNVSAEDAMALVGTPISRLGFLPDLEPLLSGSRSGNYVGKSHSTPALRQSWRPSVGEPSDRPVGADGAGMEESLLQPAAASSRRCCSLMEQGSIWGSVFNMCSATLGAGALSLPYAIQHTGILLGLVLLVCTALATHLSVTLLISAIAETNVLSYEDLTGGAPPGVPCARGVRAAGEGGP